MTRILVINGPNLNLLGSREPQLYGSATMADLEAMLVRRANELGAAIAFEQSNHEGALVEIVQRAASQAEGALVNLGAYTHTSLALRDAFLAAPIPFVEVHLSNLFRREEARHHSLIADLAIGMVTGFGPQGYLLGLEALVTHVGDG